MDFILNVYNSSKINALFFYLLINILCFFLFYCGTRRQQNITHFELNADLSNSSKQNSRVGRRWGMVHIAPAILEKISIFVSRIQSDPT